MTGKLGICYLSVDLINSIPNKPAEDVVWEGDMGVSTCGTSTHEISGFADNAAHDSLPKLIGFFGTHFARDVGSKELRIMNSLGFEYVTTGPECDPPLI